MMKLSIIGSQTGLGQHMVKFFQYERFNVFGLSRPDYDITTQEGCEKILTETEDSEIIILNAYSHDMPNAQNALFEKLYRKYKNSKKTLVIISSYAANFAHIAKTAYAANKMLLSRRATEESAREHNIKLVVIEPSYLENKTDDQLKILVNQIPFEELCFAIRSAIKMPFNFVKLTVIDYQN